MANKPTWIVGCGNNRKYFKEAQVKIAAKALGFKYQFCKSCKAFHIKHLGIIP